MAIKFLNTVQVDTDVLYVDASSNRVGIGTTTPSTDLEVSSTGVNGIDISQSASNASQSGRLFFTTNTASEGFALFNSNGTFQVNSGGIPNNTSGTNRISIIGSSGNVGIGTTSPSYKLDVSGDAYIDETLNIETTISGSLAFGYAGVGAGNLVVGGMNLASFTPGVITLINQDTTISAGQDLGVLQFGGKDDQTNGYANGQIICTTAVGAGSGNTGGGIFRFLLSGNTSGSSPSERMRITNTGSVGIGTTSPSAKLDVYGNLRLGTTGDFNITQSPFSTAVFYVAGGGNGGTITFGAPASNTQNVSVQGDLHSYQGSIGTKVSGSFNNKISYNGNNYLNSGNLGIGTTTPNAKLEVAGSTRITGSVDVGYGNNNTNYVQIGSGRTTSGFAFIDLIGDATYNDYGFRIIRNNIGPNADTDILHRGTGDLDLKTIDAGDIGLHTASIQRVIVKSGGDVGIGTTSPSSKLQVNGGVQLANDTAVASASKVGTFRYRTSGNNSYVDMCMQTGASTYAWVNIVTNNW